MSEKKAEEWYATDGRNEWTSDFAGPCATPEEAIDHYLDNFDPEDDGRVEVTRGRPCAVPKMGPRLIDVLTDAASDEIHPDAPSWPDFSPADEKSFAEVVDAAIEIWFETHPKCKPSGWIGYGKSDEMTVVEARERVAAWKAKRETATP